MTTLIEKVERAYNNRPPEPVYEEYFKSGIRMRLIRWWGRKMYSHELIKKGVRWDDYCKDLKAYWTYNFMEHIYDEEELE